MLEHFVFSVGHAVMRGFTFHNRNALGHDHFPRAASPRTRRR